MKNFVLIIFCFLGIGSFAEVTNNKILFVIDSIPVLTDPEEWNKVMQEDIADIHVITNKDSLKLLGWEQMDGITYIFTKEYRNRPDSVRLIPSLKQMVVKENLWTWRNVIYSGRYIDYYNNGKIQTEGSLLNGKLDGELTVYYQDGIKKSVTNYKDGIRHGAWKDYYKNGMLMRETEYINGKSKRTGKEFFNNGQAMYELKLKKSTGFDTSIAYYSTGKIMSMKFTRTGEFYPGKKEADINYHSTMFFQHMQRGDLKAANKSFYQLRKLDSLSIHTYFKEGLLLAHELRFDEAIAQFDKALAIEPLMREALEQRGIARIKKDIAARVKLLKNQKINIGFDLHNVLRMSEEEQQKICTDLLLADSLDPGVNYNNRAVPESILNYCRERNSR